MSETKKKRMTLSTKVFVGLGVGVAVGLFFGEHVAFLDLFGKIFIQLLQMTVLPFVVVSLIVGIGRMNLADAAALAKKGGALLLFTWGLVFLVLTVIPLAYPRMESASFFSTALVKEPEQINFLALYIPSNPFWSLTNNLVPAVVVFSIALGIALIRLRNKQRFVETMDTVLEMLTSVTHFVVGLTPYGVFAIAASAAGTLSIGEFGRLQVYFYTYIAVWAVLAFWMLPGLVMTFTPLTYRQVVGQTKGALITAFATGNLFIVLPVLAEGSRRLVQEIDPKESSAADMTGIIVPTMYSFPSMGKLMVLSFVLFAAWFNGTEIPLHQYPIFHFSGLFSLFGNVHVALPFLLNMFRIPEDMYQLFVISDVVISRFGALLAAMHLLTMALLGACAIGGYIKVSLKKVIRYIGFTALFLFVAIFGVGLFLEATIKNEYNKDKIIAGMQLMENPHPNKVHSEPPPAPDEKYASTLDRVRYTGVLKVGFLEKDYPWSYFNTSHELVGFDVEMAHHLASDMKVELQFVPTTRNLMAVHLKTGICDIVMSGILITPERMVLMSFTDPVMDVTLGFIVEDHRTEEFEDTEAVKRMKNLRIGVADIPYYKDKLATYLPDAEIVVMNSPQDFFQESGERPGAYLYSAEGGSAWCLMNPNFSMAIPRPGILAAPMGYAVSAGDVRMVEFMNQWLQLKKDDYTFQDLYNHWILGQDTGKRGPRWSVIRDVLHWVD